MEPPCLTILSPETRTAAENMAIDVAMYELLSDTSCLILRFYDWAKPAMSFGYFQAWSAIQVDVPKGSTALQFVRRPTGGGIVDHRTDLTYAIAISRNLPFAEQKTTCLYRDVHSSLSKALNKMGENTGLSTVAPAKNPYLSCFEQAVPSDIIQSATGQKLAGSAIHRGKTSILIQGSIEVRRLTQKIGAQHLIEPFARSLCERLRLSKIEYRPLSALKVQKEKIDQFSSSSWTHRR